MAKKAKRRTERLDALTLEEFAELGRQTREAQSEFTASRSRVRGTGPFAHDPYRGELLARLKGLERHLEQEALARTEYVESRAEKDLVETAMDMLRARRAYFRGPNAKLLAYMLECDKRFDASLAKVAADHPFVSFNSCDDESPGEST